MNHIISSEFPSQETADQISINGSIIAGEMYVLQLTAFVHDVLLKSLDLGGFPGSVQAFQYNEHNFPSFFAKFKGNNYFAGRKKLGYGKS